MSPVTLVKSGWQSGNLVFEQKTSGAAIHFGVDGTGLDAKFWGDTSSVYMLWDESANNLVFASGAEIDMSGDAAMLIFKDGVSSTVDPGASGATEAGWLNVHVTAASTIVYVPYYASA